jgi:hypothetical protein
MFGRVRGHGRIHGAFGATLAVAIGVAAPLVTATPALAATAVADSTANITVDGAPDAAYSQYGHVDYVLTQNATNNPRQFLARVTTVETDKAWYVYVEQPQNVKSATYCAAKSVQTGCYERWSDLVNSDYFALGFDTGAGAVSIQMDPLYLGTSDHASATTWTSGFGTGQHEAALSGITAADVSAASSYDYNYNVVGWTNTDNSPNVVGADVPGYIYTAAAEFKIDKSALPTGFVLDPTTLAIQTHDSPAAPIAGEVIDRYLELSCDGLPSTVHVGDTVSIPVDATLNGSGVSGASIVGSVSGPASLAANPISTGTGGSGSFSLTMTGTGTATLGAYWDVNGNGKRDLGTPQSPEEPQAPQVCSMTVVPAATQTLAGHIYDCTSGQTTDEVAGGTIEAKLASTADTVIAATANPLAPTEVDAGSYDLTATAPTHHHLVTCGINDSAGQVQVDVPSGGAGVGILYVARDTQTLAGHIYSCPGGTVATTTEILGGRLTGTQTGGATVVGPVDNPMAATNVTAGDYTVSGTAPAGYHFVTCGVNAAADQVPVTVPEAGGGVGILYVDQDAPVTQTLAGHIYACDGGAVTTTVEVLGGSLTGTGDSAVVGPVDNPMAATQVPAGDYVVSATAPHGYHLVTCGVNASADQVTVTVPSGGAGVGLLYVEQDTPVTQTVAGHVYNCPNGDSPTTTEVLGGTITATGDAASLGPVANPLSATEVPAGTYTMTATAPTGYQLVGCGVNETPRQQSVEVPTGGAGTGVFYVEQIVAQVQTLAGHIYSCPDNTTPTTTEVVGGSIGATGADAIVGPSANPLLPTEVPAGSYDMSASAPAGYHFVTCGLNNPAHPDEQTVEVPAGGTGAGIFYVDHIAPVRTQTIAADIYLCPGNTTPTTTEVLGGSLTATGTAAVVGPVANPMTATEVAAGDYALTATAPAGYHFVSCGTPVAGRTTVTVPPGGHGSGAVYVDQDIPVDQTLSGHIYLCAGGAPATPTTTEVTGGAITAVGTDAIVGPTANPVGSTSVPAGAYAMTVTTVPAGYQLVACGINSPDHPGSTSVEVPMGGTAVGTFFVTPVTNVLGEKIPKTPSPPSTPKTPVVAASTLPFTGTGVTSLVPGGLGMFAAGLLLAVAGRRRRRT